MKARTAQQMVDQTRELAAELYALRGYIAPLGYRFDEATHPHEVEAWRAACVAQQRLTDTDPEDALSEISE